MQIKYTLLIVTMLMCGCAASSVNELKTSPGYHKEVTVNYSYQEALKIIKDEYASMQGYDLSCTVYPDMKKGECTGTGAPGVFIFISTEFKTEKASNVNFYTAINNGTWRSNIDKIISKLNN